MSVEWSLRDLATGATGQAELSVAPSPPHDLYPSMPWLHPCQDPYFSYLPAALYLYFSTEFYHT